MRRTRKKSTPAEIVINKLGGVRETARLLDRSPSSIVRWQKAKHEGIKT